MENSFHVMTKASSMHAIEDAAGKSCETSKIDEAIPSNNMKVIIIDGMALVNKIATYKRC